MFEWLTNAAKGIVNFAKDLFKGSGTTQIGYANKSITTGNNAGIIGNILVADTIHLNPQPVPQRPPFVTLQVTFEVKPAVGAMKFTSEEHPDRSPVTYLRVTINNPTDRNLLVLQFDFELSNGNLVTIPMDSRTNERQAKRDVRPSDNLSFYVEGSVLKRFKPEHFDFQYAVVTTALGEKYKSQEGELRNCLEQLMALTE